MHLYRTAEFPDGDTEDTPPSEPGFPSAAQPKRCEGCSGKTEQTAPWPVLLSPTHLSAEHRLVETPNSETAQDTRFLLATEEWKPRITFTEHN